jgi:hypothetical protein
LNNGEAAGHPLHDIFLLLRFNSITKLGLNLTSLEGAGLCLVIDALDKKQGVTLLDFRGNGVNEHTFYDLKLADQSWKCDENLFLDTNVPGIHALMHLLEVLEVLKKRCPHIKNSFSVTITCIRIDGRCLPISVLRVCNS